MICAGPVAAIRSREIQLGDLDSPISEPQPAPARMPFECGVGHVIFDRSCEGESLGFAVFAGKSDPLLDATFWAKRNRP